MARSAFRSTPLVPDYVVLGHITLDRTSDGYVVGGTTSYGALTAQRLGYRAAIVTTGAPREAERLRQEGIEIVSHPSSQVTVFENVYHNGLRTQFLRSRADDVTTSGMPERWRQARVVHLAALTQELDGAVALEFPDALRGVTPQGWMRAWDASGRIRAIDWVNPGAVLSHIQVLVFSEQDVDGDERTIEEYVNLAQIAVVTRGVKGCTVFWKGQSCDLPAYTVEEVDPTGAGDVFAAAFLLRYAETKDPCEAGNFANCVASFAVEAPGTEGIPTRRQVLERLALSYVR